MTQITFRISICPTGLEQGYEGDMLDPDLLLAEIERVATKLWPHFEIHFDVLKIGHRQGDELFEAYVSGDDGFGRNAFVRADHLVEKLLGEIDYSAERLYLPTY